MAAQYDISIDQGSNFDFWVQYLTESNVGINLSNFSAEMQIKRYRGADYPLLFASTNGVTYGYTAGYTSGISADGRIYLNQNYDNSSLDGGIRVTISPKATNNLTQGKYFYDLRILFGITQAQRLLEGRVIVSGDNS